MAAIGGVLETAIYVDDLGRSEAFYRRLFDFPVRLADDRMRALAVAAEQMLLIFQRGKSVDGADTPGGHIPGHDGGGRLHLAFRIEPADVDAWRQRLGDLGIEIISHVRPQQGGDSLYFHDPDGHVVELATPNIWSSP